MSSLDQRNKATKYKYNAVWNSYDGWHFSFGQKKLWETKDGFVVADLKEKDGREQFQNHEEFLILYDALNYMRTGKRE